MHRFMDAFYIYIPFLRVRLVWRDGAFDGWYRPGIKAVA